MKPKLRPLPRALMQVALASLILNVSPLMAADATGSTFKKPGFYMDNFRLLPEIELMGYYDDNIYATRQSRESDYIIQLSPSLSIDSLWDVHRLALDTGARLGRYADATSEDYDDFWLNGEGDYEFDEAHKVYAGAGYSRNHEGRDSKESGSLQIDEPTTYDVLEGQLGWQRQVDQSSVKIGITYEQLDYDNVGSLYNDDRDRDVTGLGLRLSHDFSPDLQLYAQGVLNQRDYVDSRDQYGYAKDSEGYNGLIGMTRRLTKGNRIDVYVGRFYQDYEDPRFEEVNDWNFGLDLRWYPTPKTQLKAQLERTQNETTEIGSSSYLYTDWDLQIDQKLGADTVGYVGFNYGFAEFQDVGREDETRSLSLGVKYYANPWVMLSGGLRRVDNDSNDVNHVSPVQESYDFKQNLVFLNLHVRLAPKAP
ncbi:MAG: outer membrane beta-barrel protein [Candidatus Thiodiazotropha sp.]